MIGRTLGNYRIVEQAGMGGMATVYKAYDASTDRYVAIKTLPHQYSKDPNFRARFEIEARAIARLEHIHILPIFAYGEEDGIVYMAMRFMDTGTLTDLIRREKLSIIEVARILQQIAGAIDYAHENGVLHRDIKPSNILIDSQRNAFLTDFGIAKIIEGTLDLTGTGILGTPQYMSPEQCRGEKDLPPASDQYALGVVLYEMITGRTPYQAETPLAVIQKQILGDPLPPPSTLRPDLPENVEKVILKALAREPLDRFPSCLKMAEAFTQATKGITPAALTESPTADALKMPPPPETDMGEQPHDTHPSDATRSDTRQGVSYNRTAIGLQDGIDPLPDTRTEITDHPLPSQATLPTTGSSSRGWLWGFVAIVALLIVGGGAFILGSGVTNDITPTPMDVAVASDNAPTEAPVLVPTIAPTVASTALPNINPTETLTLDAFAAARATNDAESQINAARTAIFYENQTATANWWTDTPAPTETPAPTLTSTPTLAPTSNVAATRRADTRATSEALITSAEMTRNAPVSPVNVEGDLPHIHLLDDLPVELVEVVFAQDFAEPSGLNAFNIIALQQGFDNAGDPFVRNLQDAQRFWTWAPEEGGVMQGDALAIDVEGGETGLQLNLSPPRNMAFSVRYRMVDANMNRDTRFSGNAGIYLFNNRCQWELSLQTSQNRAEPYGQGLYCNDEAMLGASDGYIPPMSILQDGEWHTIEGAYFNGNLIVTVDGDRFVEMPLDRYDFIPTQMQLVTQRAIVQWDDLTVYELILVDDNANNRMDMPIQERIDVWLNNPPSYEELVPCHYLDMGAGVCIVDSDGRRNRFGALDFIQDHPALQGENLVMAVWSPDGQQVLLNGSGQSRAQPFLVDIEAQTIQPLVDNGNDNAWIDWGARRNGERIAYVENGNLVLINRPFSADSQPQTLARPSGAQCFFKPQWSPDGQRLVVYTGSCLYGLGVYDVVVWDGGRNMKLIGDNIVFNDACHHNWLSGFSPDGRVIAYHNSNCETVFADSETGETYRVMDEFAFPVWWTGSAFPRWGFGANNLDSQSQNQAGDQNALDLAYHFTSIQNNDWQPVERDFDGVPMVLVPVGCFLMGNDSSTGDEQPVHEQCFDAPFWIDKYETTNQQFADFLNANGNDAVVGDYTHLNTNIETRPHNMLTQNNMNWEVEAGMQNLPIVSITWWGAQAYCRWRNAQLPSEAEWEYVARGVEAWRYPWGNDFNENNLSFQLNAQGWRVAVGSYPSGASWVGAQDMAGSVWEWTRSLFAPYPYAKYDRREDDTGDITDNTRVFRGGSFGDAEISLTTRLQANPFETYDNVGVRCMRPVENG